MSQNSFRRYYQSKRGLYKETFLDEVLDIKYCGDEEVFDCQIMGAMNLMPMELMFIIVEKFRFVRMILVD